MQKMIANLTRKQVLDIRDSTVAKVVCFVVLVSEPFGFIQRKGLLELMRLGVSHAKHADGANHHQPG